jgi:hypothetical protein
MISLQWQLIPEKALAYPPKFTPDLATRLWSVSVLSSPSCWRWWLRFRVEATVCLVLCLFHLFSHSAFRSLCAACLLLTPSLSTRMSSQHVQCQLPVCGIPTGAETMMPGRPIPFRTSRQAGLRETIFNYIMSPHLLI